MHINISYYNNFKTIDETSTTIHGCIFKSIQTVIFTSYSIILRTKLLQINIIVFAKNVRNLCTSSLFE